MGMDLGPIT